MRVGENELGLMRGGKISGNENGLRTEENEKPKQEIEKQRGCDEHANVHASLGLANCQCNSNMASENGASCCW